MHIISVILFILYGQVDAIANTLVDKNIAIGTLVFVIILMGVAIKALWSRWTKAVDDANAVAIETAGAIDVIRVKLDDIRNGQEKIKEHISEIKARS